MMLNITFMRTRSIFSSVLCFAIGHLYPIYLLDKMALIVWKSVKYITYALKLELLQSSKKKLAFSLRWINHIVPINRGIFMFIILKLICYITSRKVLLFFKYSESWKLSITRNIYFL